MFISDLYEDDLEISIKVVIVGNGAVGKSSMIQRYCRGIFTKSYKKTIGVDFLEKQLRINGEEVRLMLWDTAGQEEFDAITKAYYRGAQACVVAFSTTDRASLDAVNKWKKKVEDECGQIPMVLVQNKIDLMHQSQVSNDEVERLSRDLGMRLYKTSVKEDLNVASVFQHLAENYVSKVKSFNDEGGYGVSGGCGGGVVGGSYWPSGADPHSGPCGNQPLRSRLPGSHQTQQLIQIGASSNRSSSSGYATSGYVSNTRSAVSNNSRNNHSNSYHNNSHSNYSNHHSRNGSNYSNRYNHHNNILTNGSVLNNGSGANVKRNGYHPSHQNNHFHQPHNHSHHNVVSSSNNYNRFNGYLSNGSSSSSKSSGSNGIGPSGHKVSTGFSPQDYLNNPMFDSLNNGHRRHRYWGSNHLHHSHHLHDRSTITLRPLMGKKLQKKVTLSNCKVI